MDSISEEEIIAKYGHLPVPKVAAFDLDNTLHDIIELYEKIFNQTREYMGLDFWVDEDFREVHKNGFVENKILFKQCFGSETEEALKYYYHCYYSCTIPSDRLLPGVTYMLYRLKEVHKIKVIGVTNAEQHMAKKALRDLGIFDMFDSITGPKGNRKLKPETELLIIGLAKIGEVCSQNIWFTGDAHTDTICARNAGCTAIRFYHGNKPPIDNFADLFCNSHFALEKIIGILIENNRISNARLHNQG